MRYEIEVTADDISKSYPATKKASETYRNTGSYCPVAFAVARTFNVKNRDHVAVNPDELTVKFGDYTLTKALPARAKRFVETYDDGEPVEPFKFTLSIKGEVPTS